MKKGGAQQLSESHQDFSHPHICSQLSNRNLDAKTSLATQMKATTAQVRGTGIKVNRTHSHFFGGTQTQVLMTP